MPYGLSRVFRGVDGDLELPRALKMEYKGIQNSAPLQTSNSHFEKICHQSITENF